LGSRILEYRWTLLGRELLAARIACHDCDRHFHDTYTVGLVRKGTVHLQLDGETFLVEPGDVFVIHPYEVHGGGNKIDAIECDILYPSIELMARVTGVAIEGGAYPYFASPVFKRTAATAQLFAVVDKATAAASASSSEAYIRHALQMLFGGRVQGTRRLKLSGPAYPSVYRAFDAMLNQLELMRGSSDISLYLGVSPFHFTRVFHKAVGMPPTAFLRQLRVARARTLIANGEPLADVATDAGFFDQAHMTREFKGVFGFPPGLLARKIRLTRSVAKAVC
jgi:AraC-like DNA-binding protein